jgi:hypothetical protein
MNIAVGIVAIAFGGWLMWLTIVRDWNLTFVVLGAPMIAGGTALILTSF